LTVVSCYTAYAGGDAPHWKVPPVLEGLRIGSEQARLDPRIEDRAYDFVLCKTAPSIFFQTAAAPIFVRNKVDTIIVTGCTTSGCVRASVIDAFSFGFRVIVPEDCVGDVSEGPHFSNLQDVGRRYADVVDLRTCLDHIAGLPRRNAE
jgi:maleamate amidohydrolase